MVIISKKEDILLWPCWLFTCYGSSCSHCIVSRSHWVPLLGVWEGDEAWVHLSPGVCVFESIRRGNSAAG
jgi:hypothetical protein